MLDNGSYSQFEHKTFLFFSIHFPNWNLRMSTFLGSLSFSQFYAELPLEPSLSRTLMEANNYGCITEALTVAAMLSTETALLPGQRLSHLSVLRIFKLDEQIAHFSS